MKHDSSKTPHPDTIRLVHPRTRDEMLDLAQKVKDAVESACNHFGCPMPRIRWSNRMTASAGKATKREVVFSVPLFRNASDAFCLETAVHEAAHYVDFQRRGTSDHGPEWRQLMVQLGYPDARRCHALDRSMLHRYEVRCARCEEPLLRYTRRPTQTLRRKRSACCYAKLRLYRIVRG